jgi:hypothetical protein
MSNPPFTAQVTITITSNLLISESPVETDSTLSNAGQIAYNDAIQGINIDYFNPNNYYQAVVSVKLTGTIIANGKSSTASATGTGNAVAKYNSGQPLTAAQTAYNNAYAIASNDLTHSEGIILQTLYHANLN